MHCYVTSVVSDSVRPQRLAHLAPPSPGLSRQEHWSGLPFPSPIICTHTHNLLLLLSRFSHVRLCATPQMAAHQAPPSPGLSRQEHWSGLPFPSPMHEREKWKGSCSVVSDSQRPHGLQPSRLPRPWDFPGKSTGVGCHCLLQCVLWRHYKLLCKEQWQRMMFKVC